MTYPASIAQISNNPTPTPVPGACPAYFTAFLALAGVVAALVIWPEQTNQPAQAHGGHKPVSMYPPGMQFDLVEEERGWAREGERKKSSRVVRVYLIDLIGDNEH